MHSKAAWRVLGEWYNGSGTIWASLLPPRPVCKGSSDERQDDIEYKSYMAKFNKIHI